MRHCDLQLLKQLESQTCKLKAEKCILIKNVVIFTTEYILHIQVCIFVQGWLFRTQHQLKVSLQGYQILHKRMSKLRFKSKITHQAFGQWGIYRLLTSKSLRLQAMCQDALQWLLYTYNVDGDFFLSNSFFRKARTQIELRLASRLDLIQDRFDIRASLCTRNFCVALNLLSGITKKSIVQSTDLHSL